MRKIDDHASSHILFRRVTAFPSGLLIANAAHGMQATKPHLFFWSSKQLFVLTSSLIADVVATMS
jgi:hypothetical protein